VVEHVEGFKPGSWVVTRSVIFYQRHLGFDADRLDLPHQVPASVYRGSSPGRDQHQPFPFKGLEAIAFGFHGVRFHAAGAAAETIRLPRRRWFRGRSIASLHRRQTLSWHYMLTPWASTITPEWCRS
jgi:hypothetical protein